MNYRYVRALWVAVVVVIAIGLPAQSQNVRLNILTGDDLALRKMVLVKKSNERITNFVKIDSYEPETGVFVIEDPTGEPIRISVSDIQRLEFEQSVRQQAPMAQNGPWEIRPTLGSGMKYKVAKGALRVEAGDLVLPGSSTSDAIPAPTNVGSQPSARHGGTITNTKVVEAKSLTVDDATNSFLIVVQNVTYTMETWGGGSRASGIVK
jgi:hypothetical protein